MTLYGFHASHEQIAPSRLLHDVQQAERVGFDAAMCSDHISPWSERQGHSGFAFSWLGAALATTSLRIGSVNAPGQRYHPAIVAQATATLAEMFPGRSWVGLGSGQNQNEHVTGDQWPGKDIRDARLEECVDIIRRLHAGEEVTHRGLVTVERTRIYDLPADPPPLLAPALSPGTAARGARWADGLITINQPHENIRKILDAYAETGGRGVRALQVHISWARTDAAARELARDQWRNNTFPEPISHDTATPGDFDIIGQHVPDETIAQAAEVVSSPDELVERLSAYEELGFDELYLHYVGQDHTEWFDLAGETLLPALRRA